MLQHKAAGVLVLAVVPLAIISAMARFSSSVTPGLAASGYKDDGRVGLTGRTDRDLAHAVVADVC